MSWHVNFLVEEHYTLWVPTRSLHWVTSVYLNLYKLFVSPLRGASIASFKAYIFVLSAVEHCTLHERALNCQICSVSRYLMHELVALRFHNELLTSIFRVWWPIHGMQRHDNVLALDLPRFVYEFVFVTSENVFKNNLYL